MTGEIQGSGDVPSMFLAQNSVTMDAHDELAPGLEMKSCTGERSIKKKNLSYVDDVKGMVLSNKFGEE